MQKKQIRSLISLRIYKKTDHLCWNLAKNEADSSSLISLPLHVDENVAPN